MTLNPAEATGLPTLVGAEVVVDLASPYVAVGRLSSVAAEFLVLEDVDLHDLRDTATTRERYVVDCASHGIRANRRRVWISRRDIVAIARLADVVVD